MSSKELNYIFIFVTGIILILLIHYFILLSFQLHPTLQVFISFILFWIWLGIASQIIPKA
ncbi:MAG: hypothetical protein AABY00_03235 [Nanoarchaeota archaeon]